MQSIQEDLGKNLVTERTKLGWEQADLAHRLKVSTLTVWRWETGRSWPKPEDLERLGRTFKIEPWRLLVPPPAAKAAKAANKEADGAVEVALATVARALGHSLNPSKRRSPR